jgi:lipid-A-disaccharide synthase
MAIVPGSRVGEIKRNLPIMLQAAEEFEPEYQIVIAGAPCIDRFTYRTLKPVIFNSTVELMHNASVAIVTSGTASLEAALAAVPQVVCYRHTGSRLTYALMSRILKIPFVTLPNLIAGKEVVPELLLHKCTPTTIKEHLTKILPNHSGRQLQMQGYELIREKLGGHGAAESAANLIVTDLLTK